MSQPLILLVAGPNGAGKSTLVQRVLQPITRLEFVNADLIAAGRWPGNEETHAYEASRLAAERRDALIAARHSFIAETVFSHESKLELVDRARTAGYLVELHVPMVPVDVTVARVAYRVGSGGHRVPEHKIRERFDRLWPLLAAARERADRAVFYDNSQAARPFRAVAEYARGARIGEARWPSWTPAALAANE